MARISFTPFSDVGVVRMHARARGTHVLETEEDLSDATPAFLDRSDNTESSKYAFIGYTTAKSGSGHRDTHHAGRGGHVACGS